jgi:hypothetical protein
MEGARSTRQWRIFRCVQLGIPKVIGTIQHPHVIVLVHGQSRHASDLPLVRQGFGPVRIELLFWCGLRLRPHANTLCQQAEAAQGAKCFDPYAAINIGFHGTSPSLVGWSQSDCAESSPRQKRVSINRRGYMRAPPKVGPRRFSTARARNRRVRSGTVEYTQAYLTFYETAARHAGWRPPVPVRSVPKAPGTPL